MALDESLRTQIAELISAHPVLLFMKGTRSAPQCGFSAEVVRILDGLLPSYETIDVLRAPEIRDGIKRFSDWPTIPQLYVQGRFIGGCDIVRDLHAAGELAPLLGVATAEAPAPNIRLSAAAARAFEAALAEARGECLRLKISPEYQYDLFFGPREAGDVLVRTGNVTLLLDRASAGRAQDLSIDFVDGPQGGFKLRSPNEPPAVKPLSAPELKALLDRGEVLLFDVRPENERALASIAEARSLDAEGQAFLLGLDRATPIALHCHHGIRSRTAAERLIREGFQNVYNLEGGIEAWSAAVDPSVPRY